MAGGWRQSDGNKGIKNRKAYGKNGGNWGQAAGRLPENAWE